MKIKTINQLELKGKKVILRTDYNVPLENKKIADTTRIDESIKTINYILSSGASKLIIMSHLGRPKGEILKKYSLKPIALYLAEKIKSEVIITESAVDEGIHTLLKLKNHKIILLENLRFHKEEENGDYKFAEKLSKYADVYINDAFGCSHRKHSSTYTILKFFPIERAIGFLIEKEINFLKRVISPQEKPFITIIGGKKVSDKIKIISSMMSKAQKILIGGAMAYPFLKANNEEIGNSLCEKEDIDIAKSLLRSPYKRKIIFPCDHIVTNSDGTTGITNEISKDQTGVDIGPETCKIFGEIIDDAKVIFWNGPMGWFEKEEFSNGTKYIAQKLVELKNTLTVVGGGDSTNAIKKIPNHKKISHISTGGGASLEFLENGKLPCIEAMLAKN